MASVQIKKYRLRVYYKKTGRAVFLSHLETIRLIDKTIRRASLPYAVSQGFSPHMKISFGPALSLGIESYEEVFDLYLTNYIRDDLALKKLQSGSVESLWPYKCEYVDNNLASLGSIFGQTKYLVQLNRRIDKLDIPKSFELIRKKKVKTIMIADYLIGKLDVDNSEDQTKLLFSLNSSNLGSLNPEIFVKNVLAYNNLEKCKIIKIKKL